MVSSAGDEGGGVGAATKRTAPRPSTLTRHRTRTRTVSMATQKLECSCSPLETLGHDQPQDSHVHGVAQGVSDDLATRVSGPTTTESEAPIGHSRAHG